MTLQSGVSWVWDGSIQLFLPIYINFMCNLAALIHCSSTHPDRQPIMKWLMIKHGKLRMFRWSTAAYVCTFLLSKTQKYLGSFLSTVRGYWVKTEKRYRKIPKIFERKTKLEVDSGWGRKDLLILGRNRVFFGKRGWEICQINIIFKVSEGEVRCVLMIAHPLSNQL